MTDEKIGKFEPGEDEGILVGYSSKSKACKHYNKRLSKIVECTDVVIDETCRNQEHMKSTED